MTGATSTAAQVVAGVSLAGQRIIVTGASSGIGLETARALASAGAEVTLAVRDEEAGMHAAEDIASTTDSTELSVVRLDLADHRSVVDFVTRWHGSLDVLINNAEIIATSEQRTPEGWELQFATNHLGHFAIALGLRRALSTAERPRIVVVSSAAHLNSDLLFDDIHFQRHAYDPWTAYAQSKTANILFAVEAARRWAGKPIAVNALNPGSGSSKNAKQGAATSVLLAASPTVAGVRGKYFEDCAVASPCRQGERRGVASYALDPNRAIRLWRMSLDMVTRAHPDSPILSAAAD